MLGLDKAYIRAQNLITLAAAVPVATINLSTKLKVSIRAHYEDMTRAHQRR